jgi:hypothetical protein
MLMLNARGKYKGLGTVYNMADLLNWNTQPDVVVPPTSGYTFTGPVNPSSGISAEMSTVIGNAIAQNYTPQSTDVVYSAVSSSTLLILAAAIGAFLLLR